MLSSHCQLRRRPPQYRHLLIVERHLDLLEIVGSLARVAIPAPLAQLLMESKGVGYQV
jgi:hypothetical protein